MTRDEGTVCREISGQKDACETYYHNGDVVSIVTGEQTSLAPNLVEGNTVVVKELYTKEQTLELVAGKTVVWDPNGGGYYAPDGRLYTLWDGERETDNWTVNDEGGVCWSVPGWGSTPCEYYYMGADGLTAVYKGQDSSASEHQEGNTLDSLWGLTDEKLTPGRAVSRGQVRSKCTSRGEMPCRQSKPPHVQSPTPSHSA